MRFDLVDQILEVGEGRIVTAKCVTSAEEYLADHFPSFPVLPGVLMVEAMVQAARRLLEKDGPSARPWVLAEVRNVRYGNMVRPGQTLKLTVQVLKSQPDGVSFQGVGEVQDQVAVQGRFTLRPMRAPDEANCNL